MGEQIRSFVAIELPDEVKQELGKVMAALGEPDIRGLRLVRAEGVHLTLKFLGDVDSDRMDDIVGALTGAVAGHSPFRLELGDAGAFPNLGRPRVLWVGVAGDVNKLDALQADVEAALAGMGFILDNRRYNPHLTLARVRNESPPSSGRSAAAILTGTPFRQGMGFHVETVSLMRTTLHPDGAIHHRMVSIPL